MTHPNPVVIPDSGVPLVEQEFEAEIARQQARLDAERAANRPAPVTPAEERTGISDVQHAVLDEVAALRREIVIGWWEMDEDGRELALARLDRIEQWTRGEKQ